MSVKIMRKFHGLVFLMCCQPMLQNWRVERNFWFPCVCLWFSGVVKSCVDNRADQIKATSNDEELEQSFSNDQKLFMTRCVMVLTNILYTNQQFRDIFYQNEGRYTHVDSICLIWSEWIVDIFICMRTGVFLDGQCSHIYAVMSMLLMQS